MPVPSDQVAALRSYLAGDFSDCGPACSLDYFMCGRLILAGEFALVVRAPDLAFMRECVDD